VTSGASFMLPNRPPAGSSADKTAGRRPCSAIRTRSPAGLEEIYTVLEGTSEIQRLVIPRHLRHAHPLTFPP
jgi:hypothetical protein